MATYPKELYSEETINNIYSKCIYTESDIEIEEGEYIHFIPIYDDKVNTLSMTEKEYKMFEELCESPEINIDRPNFSIRIRYDGGGYDYWTVQEGESNYADFTVVLKKPLTEEDYEEIRKVNKTFNIKLYDIETEYHAG